MLKMIKNLRNLKMSLPIGFFLCFKDVLVKLLKRLFIANIRSSFMQKTGLTGLLLCQLLANYNISGTKIIFFLMKHQLLEPKMIFVAVCKYFYCWPAALLCIWCCWNKNNRSLSLYHTRFFYKKNFYKKMSRKNP